MASPGELISAMAATLGLSEATIFQFDRQLAEAGLRSKSGRGRSAARVTANDAANLLIAIAATPLSGAGPKDAAFTCATFGALPVQTAPPSSEVFAQLGLPCLTGLPQRHNAITALTTLIAGTVQGEEFGIPVEGKLTRLDAKFAVEFLGPEPRMHLVGDATLGEPGHGPFARLMYFRRMEQKHASTESDLAQQRMVTFRTIRAVANAIR